MNRAARNSMNVRGDGGKKAADGIEDGAEKENLAPTEPVTQEPGEHGTGNAAQDGAGPGDALLDGAEAKVGFEILVGPVDDSGVVTKEKSAGGSHQGHHGKGVKRFGGWVHGRCFRRVGMEREESPAGAGTDSGPVEWITFTFK